MSDTLGMNHPFPHYTLFLLETYLGIELAPFISIRLVRRVFLNVSVSLLARLG